MRHEKPRALAITARPLSESALPRDPVVAAHEALSVVQRALATLEEHAARGTLPGVQVVGGERLLGPLSVVQQGPERATPHLRAPAKLNTARGRACRVRFR